MGRYSCRKASKDLKFGFVAFVVNAARVAIVHHNV